MNANRREFLIGSAGGAAAIAGAAVAAAQIVKPPVGGPVPPVKSLPWLSKLSPSVVDGFVGSASTAAARVSSHKVTAADLARASATLSVLFAHLDEIDATPELESALKTSGLLDAPLTEEQLSAVRGLAAKSGFSVGQAQFSTLVAGAGESWTSLRTLMASGGIKAVRASVVQTLDRAADNLADNQLSTLQHGGHVQQAIWWDLCAGVAVAGVYFGVWGWGLYVGAFAFGPFGEGAVAAFGLALSLVGLLCA